MTREEIHKLPWKAQEYINELERKLTLTDVSQQSELLGCEHNVITITFDRDEGVCADCGVKMIRTWQPK